MPEFIALADLLRAPAGATAAADELAAALAPSPQAAAAAAVTADAMTVGAADAGAVEPDVLAAVREARLFRARLDDALEDALARLVRELAADVLARELRLAPCDLAAIVARARAQAPVVRVRVAPGEAAREYGVPVLADAALQPGDAVLELAGGALDARLGVRLAAVLATAGEAPPRRGTAW